MSIYLARLTKTILSVEFRFGKYFVIRGNKTMNDVCHDFQYNEIVFCVKCALDLSLQAHVYDIKFARH